MDKETSRTTDIWKRISCAFFALILVSNFVLFVMSWGMKTKLDEHNRVLLTLPPDLKTEVVGTFKQNAAEIKSEVLKTTQSTSAQIVADAEKKNADALGRIDKQIKYIGTEIDKTTKTLAALKDERAQKAAMYLKAARASKTNSEIAQLLYISALTYSDEKSPLLAEYIDWQTELIKSALQADDTELAQERLIALANVCDANIALCSVNDIKSIQSLKDKLLFAEELIASHKKQRISDQQERLKGFAQRIDNLSTYEEADSLLNEFSALQTDVSLNGQKESLVAAIVLKQSCLTSPNHQLIIPAINDNTPWCPWLRNFIVRLKSDLPVSQKLEDIGAATEFLQAAKESQTDGVAELMAELEKTSRGVYLAFWQERVDRVTSKAKSNLSSTNPNLNDISTLILEYNDFKDNEQKANEKQFIELNKYLITATYKELADSLKILKSLENTVADETYMQMVGATQGQYIQLLIRLKTLDAKFAGKFSTEISKVTQEIASLGQLVNSYKNKLVVTDIKRSETQRSRFLEWARAQLDRAKELDNEGEKIADPVFVTRANDKAVEKYVSAWLTLMRIHSGDLQSADPALFHRYSELKQLIENHKSPTDHMRKQPVEYKRITDF